ncbi:type II secretory pathway pseudopilin PulG [Paucibacter oligotrophus]|uniref:Type II secretory pathway pseudopilin PulG n=1 Tax=Roseateles oligotrophus TaxID=1769250 RepID=A0A840L3F3_9BURK|nr:type II secretion system protein [Roseateles oligotrophus]MBB4842750.1 type II secretory pathway pseudopilin PulG [Roseateles oligotrophus]
MSRDGLRGFSYLGLLFFVAITAAGLAALGQSWSTAAQRERERELEFRGGEIARAIASYVRASPAQPGQNPRSLDDLLIDRRGVKTIHHLRRAYADPFTGKPDWVLVSEPGQPQGFTALHSRSERELLRSSSPEGLPLKTARDWLFDANTQALQATQKPSPEAQPALP